jgi:hypothetical protein
MPSPSFFPAAVPGPFVLPLQLGLACLLQAADYAKDCGRALWEFAVDLAELRAAGLLDNDLRWLVSRGYVEHFSAQVVPPGPGVLAARLVFPPDTYFALTPAGMVRARQVLAPEPATMTHTWCTRALAAEPAVVPDWDKRTSRLAFHGQLVKEIRSGARNQFNLLTALQAEHWPARMDNPLPGNSSIDSRDRLRDTVKRLNLGQQSALLRFHCEERGEVVRWESLWETPAREGQGRAS